jgi:3-hydroxyisobutyrate dehydrogenase-like beta-hydroxyacid dehydrogenase
LVRAAAILVKSQLKILSGTKRSHAFGAHGVAETLRPGSVIMMHSTVSPAEMQDLAAKSGADKAPPRTA